MLSHELCRSVAHDLNNIFTCVLGYAELVEAGGEDGLRAWSSIVSATERAQELTRYLLEPVSELRPRDVPVGRILLERGGSLRQLARGDTCLEVHVSAPGAQVMGLKRDYEQIVFNLVVNALAATSSPGGRVDVKLEPHGDEHVRLTVSDNGRGIADGDLARVFEPGFTTKSRGTGMGLVLVSGAVERLRGTIDIASSTAGTRVAVDLPLT